MRSLFPAVVAVTYCFLCLPAYCAPTGLIIIPTAETVGTGALNLEYQLDFPALGGSGKAIHILNTEYGIGDRLEAGVDVVSYSSEDHQVLNFKYVFWGDPGERSAAFGTYNIDTNSNHIYYAVATYALPRFRLSGGAQYQNHHIEPFIGVDHLLRGKVDICADWTAGSLNYASAGLCYQISDSWSGHLGVLLPTESDNEQIFTFCISWTGGLF